MNKELCAAWLKAKKAEEKARKQRVEIEQELEKLVPAFDGMSKTINEDGFKITVKKSESWSFLKTWDDIRESIPESLRPERVKYEVEKAGLEWLRNSTDPVDQDVYKKVSDHIEYKIGKTGFKIEKDS